MKKKTIKELKMLNEAKIVKYLKNNNEYLKSREILNINNFIKKGRIKNKDFCNNLIKSKLFKLAEIGLKRKNKYIYPTNDKDVLINDINSMEKMLEIINRAGDKGKTNLLKEYMR